jgi:hypothetical protein
MAEFFIMPDGTRSQQQSDRVYVASSPGECARQIAQAWLACTRTIPPQFAVGTALHESSYTLNELDVEPNGHRTGGIFQLDVATVNPLNKGDAARVGMFEKSVYVLDDACAIFAALCEVYHLPRIYDAVDAYNAANGLAPINRDNPPPDVWAYLAIAHNQGLGPGDTGTKGALGTILNHGLDWAAYKARNANETAGWARIGQPRSDGAVYGDDVITGGRDWDPSYAIPFDDAGAAPAIDAGTEARIRLGALLALALALAWLLVRRMPLGEVLG